MNKRNVLTYLEASAQRSPESCAVLDQDGELSYSQLLAASKRIGCALANRGLQGKPVMVAMEKSAATLTVMLGALYAGAFYVPIDLHVPRLRLQHIIEVLNGPSIIVDSEKAFADAFGIEGANAIEYASLADHEVDEGLLASIREQALETDPAYALFTSGSTGVPKGVCVSHGAIVSFIDAFVREFGIRENDRLANQAPFDFDVSVKDIFGSLAAGATLVIVPRPFFMQPAALVDYLEEKQVTMLIWAVAALCIVSTYHALDGERLSRIRKVMFSGEVMPLKHLREWRAQLPDAEFVNLYGPTEITCNCLFHRLDPACGYEDGIPLGKSFAHCNVLLLDANGAEVTQPEEQGEIVVRGPSLALGYIGAPEATAKAFTSNPANALFPERIYRTGDMAYRSAEGQLFFCGRKDNQIKLQGHRIELEEIDVAFEKVPGVMRCRCVFDAKKKRLRAFYEGSATEADLLTYARENLPAYMKPASVELVADMPLTKNGKVDRAKLLESSAHASKRHTKKAD